MAQIMRLYHDRYISLEKAKELANRHVHDVAVRISWVGVTER